MGETERGGRGDGRARMAVGRRRKAVYVRDMRTSNVHFYRLINEISVTFSLLPGARRGAERPVGRVFVRGFLASAVRQRTRPPAVSPGARGGNERDKNGNMRR